VDVADFLPGCPGTLTPTDDGRGVGAMAFVPHGLPPEGLVLPEATRERHERAVASVARLTGASEHLPNPLLLAIPLQRQEALASTAIEGTVSSATELLLFEKFDAGRGAGRAEEKEVLNYIQAMTHGLDQMEAGRAPSVGLLREMHEHLITGTRGGQGAPGQLRSRQNWITGGGSGIGQARFVPPPAFMAHELLAQLEAFIASPPSGPRYIQLALIHYQFETIHPFEDGNGRLGRLLIPLLLCHWQFLHAPLIYVSTYVAKHDQEYRDLLLRVSQRGEWVPWIDFFLEALTQHALSAHRKIGILRDVQRNFAERIAKSPPQLARAVDHLFFTPVVTAQDVAEVTSRNEVTAWSYIRTLERLGILKELTERGRKKVFAAPEIIALLYE
jgi:Fic family protein